MWNIKKIISKGDYNYALVPNHPNATKNGYVLLHRVIMENYIGRLLDENEIVHHKDHNKKNNDISNLEVLKGETTMKAKVKETEEIVDVYHEPQHGQITNIYKESVFVNGRIWTEDELEFIESKEVNLGLKQRKVNKVMTQEEKLLLLEDLGSRLMYGVIVDYKDDEYDHHKWKITTLFAPAYSQDGTLIDTDHEGWIGYDDYKGCGMSSGTRPLHLEKNLPYLRPLSSMTEEEFTKLKEYSGLIYNHQLHLASFQNGAYKCLDFYLNEAPSCAVIRVFDWLNRKMFDYRGLIEKGLALEAPEGMYEHEPKSDVNESGSRIGVGCKIRSKTSPYEILSIISNDCHGDEFECSNGSVLSLKQIEKYYDIIT